MREVRNPPPPPNGPPLLESVVKTKTKSRKVVNEHMPLLKMVRIRRAQIADSTVIIVAPRAKQGQQVCGPEGALQAGRHGLLGDRPGERRGETRAASRVVRGELKLCALRVIST